MPPNSHVYGRAVDKHCAHISFYISMLPYILMEFWKCSSGGTHVVEWDSTVTSSGMVLEAGTPKCVKCGETGLVYT